MDKSQPMEREHILSKDCWCKPSVINYCGKDDLFEQLAGSDKLPLHIQNFPNNLIYGNKFKISTIRNK